MFASAIPDMLIILILKDHIISKEDESFFFYILRQQNPNLAEIILVSLLINKYVCKFVLFIYSISLPSQTTKNGYMFTLHIIRRYPSIYFYMQQRSCLSQQRCTTKSHNAQHKKLWYRQDTALPSTSKWSNHCEC